jgi:beta-glucosidase
MKRWVLCAAFLCGAIVHSDAPASPLPIYKDPHAPTEARVKDLLGRMTPEEKFGQLFMLPGNLLSDSSRCGNGLFGLQVPTGAGSPATVAGSGAPDTAALKAAEEINALQRFFVDRTRLGIPLLPFDEALHGLVRPGAVAFPQAIGLAATFDPALVGRVAAAVARECRGRGIRQVLSPVANVATDVRWGRVEETYGEDPFLCSRMCLAFVSAFESLGVIATPKHFLANVGDGGRDSYPVGAGERWLREVVLPPFEVSVREGRARSIMTAYNSLDGTPCSANAWLLRHLLKDEWGFRGFVISDACAVGGANALHLTAAGYEEAAVQALEGGLDVIFQTSLDHERLFLPPFLDGRIAPAVIDSAVVRVLRAKFDLGLFDQPYVDPRAARRSEERAEERRLALEAAGKSIVLLKNDGKLLPMGNEIKTLAVIGPDAAEARLGGYSGPGIRKISILEGIRAKVAPAVKVLYAKGCGRTEPDLATIPSEDLVCRDRDGEHPGLLGEYFAGVDLRDPPTLTRIDARVDFHWTLDSPDPHRLARDFYSVRWSGWLEPPETGTYSIGVDGNDGYRLWADGRLLIDNWGKRSARVLTAPLALEKGRRLALRLECCAPTGNARVRLVWDAGSTRNGDQEMEEAVRAATQSDAVVLVASIEEGEFRDRALLSLPGRQEELIRRIAATGRPVAVVLVAGSAVTMDRWLDSVGSVLLAWYPGEEGGTAVADILFGDANPAGRLPITFPRAEGQLPLVYNHKPTGRGDDYRDLTGLPLFPFGYGLSYTDFEYSGLTIDRPELPPGAGTAVRFRVTNAGQRGGEEVVQLYIHDLLASVARPVMELKGVQRVFLRPGESRELAFEITPRSLGMLDQDLHFVVEKGEFRIMIGASSQDIRLCGTLRAL